MFKITISTVNAAFQEGSLNTEIAKILYEVSEKLGRGSLPLKLCDTNGNPTGWAEMVATANDGHALTGDGLVVLLETDETAPYSTISSIIQKELSAIRSGERDLSGQVPLRDLVGASVGTITLHETSAAEDEDEDEDEDEPNASGETFEYFINLDERGEFRADVRNSDGNSVFEVNGPEIFEDGFMRHKRDLAGLTDYLQEIGIISAEDRIIVGN